MSINSDNFIINKKTLNDLLNKLSKVYKKLYGRKAVSQIVLVGGASVLEAYNFRAGTSDIDAFGNILKEAVVIVADENNLPYDWLNKDFMMSQSYNPKLYDYSVYYKTFNQVFEVRIIKGACLIAMKLNAARTYKKDLSDIIGILKEEKESGHPISLDEIKKIYSSLYGSYDSLSEEIRKFIEGQVKRENYDEEYYITSNFEAKNKEKLKKEINKNLKLKIVKKKTFTNEMKKEDLNKLIKTLENKKK